MAAEQRNFQNYLYTDDDAVDWTKRGEQDAVRGAVDGHADSTGAPVWQDSARRKARHVIAQDPTTFRTKRIIIYTPTAFAAIAKGDVLAFHVEGNTATVNYSVIAKIAEKQPGTGTARQLADHA